MSDQPDSTDKHNAHLAREAMRNVPWLAHTLVSIAFLAIAFVAVKTMFASKPEARKFGSRPSPAVTVETTQVKATDFQVWIDSYGSATPLTLTNLVSDVSGRVIEVSEKIRAGSQFEKNEVLLRIEPRDYQIAVNVAEAAVADAEVKYKQELAEAEIAKQDWNIKPKGVKGKSLALREPQVKAAYASLQSAKARLDQAKLDLERTQVKAPFSGKVLTQHVDVGQVVSPSQAIAEIYATEMLEVRLPIKTQDLHQIDLLRLEASDNPPKVILQSRIGNKDYQWFGTIVRSEGAYDRTNRMLYVVARIDDPFKPSSNSPAMRVGQFFEAKIEGRLLQNVFTLPRRAVSQDHIVSIAHEGQLTKIPVEPLWTDKSHVVVSAEDESLGVNSQKRRFTEDDLLILTPTANLLNGTRIKLIDNTQTQKLSKTDKAGSSSKTLGGQTP